jgi:hypothetical protein
MDATCILKQFISYKPCISKEILEDKGIGGKNHK